MPQSWDWAVQMYSETSVPAVVIARATGMSLNGLYQRMNRLNIHKFHHRDRQGASHSRPYLPEAVEAMRLAELGAEDAALLASRPMFRCDSCGGKSVTPRCACGAIINPFLVAV